MKRFWFWLFALSLGSLVTSGVLMSIFVISSWTTYPTGRVLLEFNRYGELKWETFTIPLTTLLGICGVVYFVYYKIDHMKEHNE